jgi:hypothetical protein
MSLELTEEITGHINGAAANGTPMSIAYVDEYGHPHLSLRGTVQVLSDGVLGLWARSPRMPEALPAHPHVALLYLDAANRVTYQIEGTAHVAPDAETRDRIFESSPEREQAQDPSREGTAVVVEVDMVKGRNSSGSVSLFS